MQVSTSSRWSSSDRSSWWTSFLVCSLESSQRSLVFISSFFQPSTLTKDKLVRSEHDWVWLVLMKYYIIVNNSCQSKKKDHLLNTYKPSQDRITHHLSDVEPLQEREKSQSRGDFQKMRAKQQMDEDLQGYQVFHHHHHHHHHHHQAIRLSASP